MQDKQNNISGSKEQKSHCAEYSAFIMHISANGHPCFDAPERHKNSRLQSGFLSMGSKMDDNFHSFLLCESLNSQMSFLEKACIFEMASKGGYSK